MWILARLDPIEFFEVTAISLIGLVGLLGKE